MLLKCPKCGNEVVQGACRQHYCGNCAMVVDDADCIKEQTNEEWFTNLSTEEKAKALETIIRSVLVLRSPMCHDVCNREFWEKWLKEKHE